MSSKREPTTLDIELKVNPETGDFTCEPTVLHAIPGDTIRFSAGKKPFSVVAKGLSCFDRLDIRSDQHTEWVEVGVLESAKTGSYSFACAVDYAKGNKNKISMDANCPQIIIDPGFNS